VLATENTVFEEEASRKLAGSKMFGIIGNKWKEATAVHESQIMSETQFECGSCLYYRDNLGERSEDHMETSKKGKLKKNQTNFEYNVKNNFEKETLRADYARRCNG
jgi:hypothetical protein